MDLDLADLDDDLFRELNLLLLDSSIIDDSAGASNAADAADAAVASDAAYDFVDSIIQLDLHANAFSERGIRRKQNRRRHCQVAVLAGLPSPSVITLLERLPIPPVSLSCSAFAMKFTNDAASSDAAMTAKELACSFLLAPIFCRRVMVSTMTLGVHLGPSATEMLSNALGKVPSETSMRDRLEVFLASPIAKIESERIFGTPWAITHAEKSSMRFSSKLARKRPFTAAAGLEIAELDLSRAEQELEQDQEQEQRVFANAVIIMISDAVEANIKSCKVFTSGVLHITGCLSIDEGLRVAGAVGQVVRLALGLPDTGPHHVEAVDVQMINTDFSLDMSIDRCALERVINRVPPPQPCTAVIPPTKHASIKLLVSGVKHGTVLVFTTGKIMMTGFKNWIDLRKAFEYTVDVITLNADDIRSEVKQQARVNLNSNRGRSNKNIGVNSPIMRLLPPPCIDS